MDGTIYLGKKLFPFTKTFLEGLSKAGKKFIFLTNNSSKNANDYYEKLTGIGLRVDKSQIYTSGDATIEYLNEIKPGARVYLMGTKNLSDDFERAGFSLVEDNPDFVVLGFDLTFTYQKFDKGARFIRNKVPFIATHPDLNCPIEDKDMIPDCGALSAAFTAATGVKPKVLGKPNQEMLDGLLKRMNVTKEELCLMGDRLMTDIKMGRDFGILSILVLTGEASVEDLKKSDVVPDLILEKNIDLLTYIE
jgi:HAD superfamily hydrolase (TIGR01457 family)